MTSARISNQVVDLPTGPVFYRDSLTDGAPVVLLHAASGNSLLWDQQFDAYTTAGYRCVALDYRGVAASAGPYDWSDQIDALVDHLGIDRFHLLGTAAGGGAAFQYALAYKRKVRSLTIANSHGNVTDEDYVELGKRLRPAPLFDQLPVEFRELGPSYRAAEPAGVARWLGLSSQQPGAYAEDGTRSAMAALSRRAKHDFTLKPDRAVTWARLRTLDIPILLITGDADLYMPPAVLRLFLSHLPGAEWAIIPETGHSSYWESPDRFNTTVLDFLRKH